MNEIREIIGNTTATPNPHPDWNQTDSRKADYIKNKPTLGALAAKDTVAKADIAPEVQASLDKADSALQSYTETDPTVPDHVKKITETDISAWNAKSDFSGSYTNLDNIPETFKPSDHAHDYIPTSQKGSANGVAELDTNGKVPSTQLPSYVDDVIEYSAKSLFPEEGEDGKIYIDTATNITYRWGGTTYVPIGSDLALGTTPSTAYYGDKGKVAYDHSQTDHAPSNAEKNQNAFSKVEVNGQTTVEADNATGTLTLVAGNNVTIITDADNNKVTIDANDTVYTHPDTHDVSMITDLPVSVKKYIAVGDIDDTKAIQDALAENRCVYIPGGTYNLSGELLIRDNCELTLSQDTVLNFTQTSGNCISMKMSASIMGHHATVNVPYEFTGNVIYVSSTLDDNVVTDVPPWIKWSPSWKAGRYIKDLNICKTDYRGFHYSVNGDCSGTGIYISADGKEYFDTSSTFIWGLNFSGIRIAGAFTYGIKAINFNNGWNHEMRIEAFLDACETAVSLEDCNKAYISAVFQPRRAYTSDKVYIPYAKCGIELIRSLHVDLHGSRIWDWNSTYTLWTSGGRYQHIAMIGDCTGTVLDDYSYWAVPEYDIRDLIYTDTPSNLEKMTIIQEPITRWFKPMENKPYFNDGKENHELITREILDSHFVTDMFPDFKDWLKTASDGQGNIFNGIGYLPKGGYVSGGSGQVNWGSDTYGCTGYIACKAGNVIRIDGITFDHADGNCAFVMCDSSFNHLNNVNGANITSGASVFLGYKRTDYGVDLTVKKVKSNEGTEYIRFGFRASDLISAKPAIAVDEEISYSAGGFLADNVKVNKDNIVGLNATVTAVSANSTDQQTPTAKAVYEAIQNFLGVIENGTY